jgi:Flp pilus assembly protein TadG
MRRNEQGANLAEFAIISVFLFLLIAGIVDLGRAYYSYMVMTNATRDAVRQVARYAKHLPIDNAEVIETIVAELQPLVDTGQLSCSAPVPEKVADYTGTVAAVRVSLECSYNVMFPVVDDFPIRASAAMMIEGL